MNINQLQVLCSIARAGSFTRASEELFISQPAVSNIVLSVEKYYNVKIFDRTKKGVTLTDAGKIILKSAEDILRIHEETRQSINDLENFRKGTITIQATPIAGNYIMPELIGKFHELYPLVDLSMSTEHVRVIFDCLADKNIQIGIFGEGIKFDANTITIKPFLEDELVLVASPNYFFENGKWISPLQLTQYPFIAYGARSATYQFITSKLGDIKSKLSIAMILGSTEAIKNAVIAGYGISIMSERSIIKELLNGHIKAYRLFDINLKRYYYLAWSKSKPRSKLLEFFINFIIQNVKTNEQLLNVDEKDYN